MSRDIIRFEILDDGTIKTTTDAVSMPNHQNAEAFLRRVQDLAGGPTEVRKRTPALAQHHHHHAHEEAGH